LDDLGRHGGTNVILKIRENETRLNDDKFWRSELRYYTFLKRGSQCNIT